MSPLDHLLWLADREPGLRSTMTSVALFDGTCDAEAVRQRFEQAAAAVPRLRQRVVGNPLSVTPPRWEVDPRFELDQHLHFEPAPEGGDLRAVLDRGAQLAAADLHRDRPQWEAWAIEGLADGGWAMVMKGHHALTDGIGALQIQLALFDLDDPAADPVEAPSGEDVAEDPGPRSDRPLTPFERLIDAALWESRQGLDLVDRGLGAAARVVTSPRRVVDVGASAARTVRSSRSTLSPVLQGRGGGLRFDAMALPLRELKAAAVRAGTRLNAVFLAGFAEGLRRYHDAHGGQVEALHCGLPISTRGDARTAGNHILPVRFDLPLIEDRPAALARRIEALVAQARDEPVLGLLPELVLAITRLPPPLASRAYRETLSGIDVQASNIPGSPVTAHLAGSRLIAQYPFGPLAASACSLTLLSYRDTANLGLTSCPAAVPDPEALVTHLRAGFDHVLAI